MKYVAVCVLSILTMLSASASPPAAPMAAGTVVPSAQLFSPSLLAPAEHAAKDVRVAADEIVATVPDSLLMTMLSAALIALQLRRRQKSLRSPRLAILSG